MSTNVFSAKWNWYISTAHACAELWTHICRGILHTIFSYLGGFLCASMRLLNDRKWGLNHLWKKKDKSEKEIHS